MCAGPLTTEGTFRRFNATIGHCDSLASTHSASFLSEDLANVEREGSEEVCSEIPVRRFHQHQGCCSFHGQPFRVGTSILEVRGKEYTVRDEESSRDTAARAPWSVRRRALFSWPMGDMITGAKEVDDMSSLLTIAGVFRDGTVEFAERPAGVGEYVPVLVTFLPASQGASPSHRLMRPRRVGGLRGSFLAHLKQGVSFGRPPNDRCEELCDRADRRDDNPD